MSESLACKECMSCNGVISGLMQMEMQLRSDMMWKSAISILWPSGVSIILHVGNFHGETAGVVGDVLLHADYESQQVLCKPNAALTGNCRP